MARMRAVQVREPNGPLELVEREILQPSAGHVRIKVQACGICHSDSLTKNGFWPDIRYPRVPGHEVAGVIDAIGPGVAGWKTGQRVGVGWHGGHCGYCDSCRRGDFVTCQTAPQIPGVTFDGGYADFMVAPAAALALIPEELSAVEAGPLMCAGITTYNSLRNSGARPGDVVAILGVGGLGHLAVQFAAKMGFLTVAIARGKDKESLERPARSRVLLGELRYRRFAVNRHNLHVPTAGNGRSRDFLSFLLSFLSLGIFRPAIIGSKWSMRASANSGAPTSLWGCSRRPRSM